MVRRRTSADDNSALCLLYPADVGDVADVWLISSPCIFMAEMLNVVEFLSIYKGKFNPALN
jgi:hypothetical protein